MSDAARQSDAADERLGRFRFARFVLAFSMMVMGACGIIYEYVLSVLGSNLMGSSHEQLFVIIGIMMFAMGVGSVVQRRVTRDLLDRFLLFELILGLVGGLSSLLIYTAFVYTASYQVIHYGFAFLIGLLIGLEVPLLIRINTEYSESLRTNLSEILCMDYVGSLAGALLFAYVLLSRVDLARINVALGGVSCLIALGGLIYFAPLVRRPRLLAGASVLCLAVLGLSLHSAPEWTAALEQRCYEDPIIHRETTRYQHLVLTKRDGITDLYINGHLQFSSRDERIYHDLLVHPPLAVAPRRSNVLILGGGDGLGLREVLRYGDVERVTLVDIDPGMIRLAAEHPDLVRLNRGALHDARVRAEGSEAVSPGRRVVINDQTKLAAKYIDRTSYPVAEVHVHTIDADRFIQQVDELYDVAILDFPDPNSVEVAKLYSVEFYRALAQRLTPSAVISVQSGSPHHARDMFVCIGETLRTAGYKTLPYQQLVPSFGSWGWHLAWRAPTTAPVMRQRLERIESFDVPPDYLTPAVLRGAFAFGRGVLDGAEVRPNTKMQPVMVEYYKRSWK